MTLAEVGDLQAEIADVALTGARREEIVQKLRAAHGNLEGAWASGRGTYDKVLHTAVRELLGQEERRQNEAMFAAVAAREADAVAARRKRDEARVTRWAALSPLERALHIVASEKRGTDIGLVLTQIVSLASSPTGAAKQPVAATFEPQGEWG